MLNLVIWAFLVALTPLALGLARMLMSGVGDLIVVRHSQTHNARADKPFVLPKL